MAFIIDNMLKKYRFFLLGVSLAIMAIIVWYSNPAALLSLLSTADMRYIALAFVLSNISICFRVLKWKALLNKVGFRELYPVQMLGITISNFTPGKLGEPIKTLLLKMRKGIAVSESLSSILWERVLDIIILCTFALFALQTIGLNSDLYFVSLASIAIFAAIIITFLLILESKRIGMKIFSFFKKFPLLNKISEDFIETFYKSKVKKRKIALSIIFTAIPWLLEGFVFYCAFMAFGISLSPLNLAWIVALSVLIGVASFLPGGIGSTDAAMIFLLGIMGIGSTIAVATVLLYRFISMWYGVFVGGLSFVYLSRKIDLKKIL
jgi:glycosyltransferase 2 family protein